MKFNRMASILLACTLSSISVFAQEASTESVKNLMKRSGAAEMGIQMMNQMLPALKRMIPDAPEEFWVDMMKEINADAIIDQVIPIYQKHLTQKDVLAITEFFNTEAGKKLVSTQPQIMQESMIVGQQWGQETAMKVMEKYKKQFPAQ